MLSRWFVIGASAILLCAASVVAAGVPTEKIRDTSNKIIAIVKDSSLKSPAKEPERRAKIRAEVDNRFDWTEMAKRSLARRWAERTPQEKKDFTKSFSDLLERTYMDKVEGYKGQPINYLSESIDGDYAVVKVSVMGDDEKSVIPVEYRLMHKNNDWLVYDISIEGVSIISNYRKQFSDILASSSFATLMKRIKAKTEEKKTE